MIFSQSYYNVILPPSCNSPVISYVAQTPIQGLTVNSTTGSITGVVTAAVTNSAQLVIVATGINNVVINIQINYIIITPDDSRLENGAQVKLADGTTFNNWRYMKEAFDTYDIQYSTYKIDRLYYLCNGKCDAVLDKTTKYYGKWTASLYVESAGTYNVKIHYDDRVAVFIDDMDNEIGTNTAWNDDKTYTVEFTAGWHPIMFISFQDEGGHGMEIQWKKSTDSSFSIIENSIIKFLPAPVQSVSYFSDEYVAYTDQVFSSKPTVYGYLLVKDVVGSNQLTNIGLSVDVYTGTINGEATYIDGETKIYTIEYGNGVNDFGKFTLSLQITVLRRDSQSMVAGLRAKYYKSPGRGCEWREIGSDDTLSYSRIDYGIQHSQSDDLWSELTADFQQYYTVEWEGQLVPQTSGYYDISVSAEDGVRVEVNNTVILAEGLCNNVNIASGRVYLVADVNPIRIVYWKAGGSRKKSLQILWASSSQSISVPISESYFGRLPTKSFNFKYDTSTYIVGVEIYKNCPVYKRSTDSYTSFTIEPSLPSGLAFDSNNCISGTPATSTPLIDYKITAMDGTNKRTTTTQIYVKRVSAPTHLSYNGIISADVGTPVLLTATLVAPEDSTVSFFSNPSMPSGLVFNSNGDITGVPVSSYSGTITISAVNEAGSIETTVSINIMSCPTGSTFSYIRYTTGDPEVLISIFSGSTLLYSKTTHIVNTEYSGYFCVPNNQLSVEITGTAKRSGTYTIFGENNLIYRSGLLTAGTISINLAQSGPPSFSYGGPFTYVVDEEIYLYPTNIQNGAYSFSTNGLPSGLYLNTTTGGIYGSADSAASSVAVTVIANNIIDGVEQTGQATVTLTFLLSCDNNKMLMTIVSNTGNSGSISQIRISGSVNTEFVINYDSLPQNTNFRFSKCVSQDSYDVIYGSTVSGQTSSSILIYRDKELINTLSSSSTQTTSFSFFLAISSDTEWEYSSSASSNWFNETGIWPKARCGSFPIRTTTTTYYRTTFDTTYLDLTSLLRFELTMTYKEGIVIYLNGKDFYRRNLPKTGTITSETKATRLETLSPHPLYGNARLLKKGINIIAVETHRHTTSTAEETFSASLFYNSQSDGDNFVTPNVQLTNNNRWYFTTNVGSDWSSGAESFSKTWDRNVNTKYVVSIPSGGVTARYTLFNKAATTIEKYVIGTGNDCISRDPKAWKLEGMREFDGITFDTWEIIDQVNDDTVLPGVPNGQVQAGDQADTRKKLIEITVKNPKDYVFEAYRFTFTAIKKVNDGGCGNVVQMSELNVKYDYPQQCPKDGKYPATIIGGEARIACDTGYEGIRTRFCNTDGTWEDEDVSQCTADTIATVLQYNPQSYDGLIGVLITQLVPNPNGAVIRYTISPSLPNGIVIDRDTGLISGTPSVVVDPLQKYTITGETLGRPVTAAIILKISTSKCSAKTEFGRNYPETPLGGIITGKCREGMSGYSTSTCISTSLGVTWSPWDYSDCVIGISPGCNLIDDIVSTVNTQINKVITCTRPPTTISVEPYLPSTIQYIVSGNSIIISGTPTSQILKTSFSFNATYLNTGFDIITFSLSVYSQITTCKLGYTGTLPLLINSYVSLLPAECNADIQSYSSTNLPPGLSIDENTGYISGYPSSVYSGSITVTVTNIAGSFNYQMPVSVSETGGILSGLDCWITGQGQGVGWLSVYNDFNNNALAVTKLPNMPENFANQYIYATHTWPGEIVRATYYWVLFKGYLTVDCPGLYDMYIKGDDRITVFIDDLNTPKWASNIWNEEIYDSIQLTAGNHEFFLMYMQAENAGDLILKWKCENCGIIDYTVIPDSKFIRGSTDPLQKISYPVSEILFVRGLNTGSVSPIVVGDIIEWSIDRDLPPGINFENGVFSGTPYYSFDRDTYTVTAKNIVTCTATILIGVLDNSTSGMASGLDGYYYSGTLTSCDPLSIAVIRESYNHRFKRVESSGIQFADTTAVWNGLSAEFQNSFIAYWSGYLYVPETADFTFTMTCEDWCRLHIGNEDNYYSNTGCGKTTRTITLSLNGGFMFFSISFGKTVSGRSKSMSISWSQDTGNMRFTKQLLTNDYLYHKPDSYLSYTYSKAIYVSGADIPPNNPIFIESRVTYNSFTVSPQLPAGISINERTGVISGRPTVYSAASASYIITAAGSSQSLSATITLSVEPRYLPQNLTYPAVTGDIGQELFILINNVKVTTITPTIVNGVSVIYQIESDNLPNGLTFNQETGGVSGTPLTTFSGVITISATNPSGTTYTDWNLVINGCSSGRVFQQIDYTSGYGDVTVTVKDNSGIKYYEKTGPLVSFSKYQYLGCVTPSTYIFEISTGSNHLFGGTYVIFADGKVIKSGVYNGTSNTVFSYTYSNILNSAIPVLEYPQTLSIILGQNLAIGPNYVTNGASSFNCLTTLPEDVNFDKTTGLLTGLSNSLSFNPTFTLTITATNSYGTSLPATIILDNLGECPNKATFFSVRFSTQEDGSDMYVRMKYYSSSSYLFTVNGFLPDYSINTIEFCIAGGIYQVETGSVSQKEWPTDARFAVLMDGEVLYDLVHEGGATVSQRITLANYIRGASLWYYGNTEPTSDLWKYELDNTLFTQRLRATQFPPRLSITSYYAAEFYFDDDVSHIYSLNLGITYDAGIIVYLNGRELYRKFLPTSGVSHSTRANGVYTDVISRSIVAGQMLIQSGKNYIAIETHKHRNSKTVDPFRASATPVIYDTANCWGRTPVRNMKTKSTGNKVSHDGTNGIVSSIDYDIATTMIARYETSEAPIEITYTYVDEKAEFFSRFDYYTGANSGNFFPKGFKIYASNEPDSTEWDLLLDNQADVFGTGSYQVKNFELSNNYKPYNSYKFRFEGVKGLTNGKFEIRAAEIRAVSCTFNFCPSVDDWPQTAARYTAKKLCNETGYSGYIVRDCLSSAVWGQPDSSRCLRSATSISYESSTLDFPIGSDKSYIANTNSGGVNRFSISCSLPRGVQFDPDTGTISGTATSQQTSTCVITAITNDGSKTVTVTVSSNYMTCSEFDGYESVFVGEYSYKTCDRGYEGFKRRLCEASFSYSGIFGSEDTSGCRMLPPQFSYGVEEVSVSVGTIKQLPVTVDSNFVTPNTYTLSCNDGTTPASLGITINNGNIAIQAQNVYDKQLIITGTNNGGSTSIVIRIAAFAAGTNVFRYASVPSFSLTRNVPINTASFPVSSKATVSGVFTTITTTPPLPAGVKISTIDGLPYGTPTEIRGITSYSVTADTIAAGTISLGVTSAFCAAIDTYQSVEAGNYSNKTCDYGYSGEKYRYCPLSSTPVFEEEVNNCIENNPKAFSYPDNGVARIVVDVDASIEPIIDGNLQGIDFKILSGEMPEGLYLDTNGKILGTPSQEGSTQLTIQAKGSTEMIATLQIIIVKVYCPANSYCQQTQAGGLCSRNCLDGFEGVITIRCSFSAEPSWEEEDTSACIASTPTSITYNTNNNITFYVGILVTVKPVILGGQPSSFLITQGSVPEGVTFKSEDGSLIGIPTNTGGPFTLTITASNDRGSVSAALTIYSVNAECPADDPWPATLAGAVAQLNCDASMVGYIVRECPREANPVWKDPVNNCRYGPPSFSYGGIEHTIYVSIDARITPTEVQGSPTRFYIQDGNEDLPTGLKFDETTGIISGKITEKPSKDYVIIYILADNSYGTSTPILISINIIQFSCSSEGAWPSAIYGDNSAILCDNGYYGIQTRKCDKFIVQSSHPIGRWGNIDNTKCVLDDDLYNPPTDKIIVEIPLVIPRMTINDVSGTHYQALQSSFISVLLNISSNSIKLDPDNMILAFNSSTSSIEILCLLTIRESEATAKRVHSIINQNVELIIVNLNTYINNEYPGYFSKELITMYSGATIITPTNYQPPKDDDGVNVGMIIGIVIAVLAILIIIIGCLYCRCVNRTVKKATSKKTGKNDKVVIKGEKKTGRV